MHFKKIEGLFCQMFLFSIWYLSTGVIHALHKGGDALQFENYRGITVGPVLAKVFAMILEARLSSWAEEKGLRARGQAGFHP
jgi:hypothetical protein